MQMFRSVCRRRGALDFPKHTGKMTRVLKSCVQSCIDNTALGVSKLLLGAFDPPHQYCSVLPQRIILNGLYATHVVDGSRIGPSSLGKGTLFHPPAVQQSRQAEVSLDAARLVINSVLLVALLGELLLDGPWTRPHGGIFDGHFVFEGLWPGAGPALDEVHVFARAEEIGFRTEVGHVDHQRVALPVASRIAEPLADIGRQVRAAAHSDVALPALALIQVVEHGDAAGRLNDSTEAATEQAAEVGQPAVQTAVSQRVVLGPIATVEAVEITSVVARRWFGESWRRRRIVLAAGEIGRAHV